MVLRRSTKDSTNKSTRCQDLYSRIQHKAYELYEKRGHTHGNDWADWFEAERQVKREVGVR
jgi:hypothetical protein